MSVIDIIKKRHSYRGKFKSIPVPREDLVTIMEAGLAAPSGCNKQTTSLIAVDDPVGIAQEETIGPKKQAFAKRAWFNGFGGTQDE